MHKLTATFRIVTPMFIAGADQQKAELRAPSIKGALRFWWRALNWSRFSGKAQDENGALSDLRREEERLFGVATDAKKATGAGLFSLFVGFDKKLLHSQANSLHQKLKPTRTITRNGQKQPDPNHLAGARYLGYGAIVPFNSNNTGEKAGQLKRGCLIDDQTFFVKLAFRGEIEESILAALKVFGLLGGLGSRSRHGFGSISIVEIKKEEDVYWRAPTNTTSYIKEIKTLLEGCNNAPLPGYSAFSTESRVDIVLADTSPYEVLDKFGLSMLDYRSWGRTLDNGTRLPLPSGKESEERFRDDHDWYRKERNGWRSNHPDFHPKRVVFGLPHNYNKNPLHHVIAAKHERRSSPLLFHVHRFGDSSYIGVTIFLKSRFLPCNEKIKTGNCTVPQDIDWGVITEFLDGREGNPPSLVDRFPSPPKTEIHP